MATEAQRRAVKARADRLVEQGYKKATFWLRPHHNITLGVLAEERGVSRQKALELLIEQRGDEISGVVDRITAGWTQPHTGNERQSFGMRASRLQHALKLYAAHQLLKGGEAPDKYDLEAVAKVLLNGGQDIRRESLPWEEIAAQAEPMAAAQRAKDPEYAMPDDGGCPIDPDDI